MLCRRSRKEMALPTLLAEEVMDGIFRSEDVVFLSASHTNATAWKWFAVAAPIDHGHGEQQTA
jgi:hypothetical protein